MNIERWNFSDDFQDLLLACLIKYPDKFLGMGEIVKPEYFNGPAAVEVTHHMLTYHAKYGKYPNFTVLANYAVHKSAKISKEHAKSIVDYVGKIATVETEDWNAVRDMAVHFARERAVYDGLRQIHAAQAEGKVDAVNAVQIMEKALAVGTDFSDLGVSLYHDSDAIIDTATARDYGIMTGYAHLDAIWKFGWGPGWLIVPLAPPKRLKTAFCVNLAMNMATHGKSDVLYYACEISQELAALRAIYNLSGYTQQQIWDSPELYKVKVKKKIEAKLVGNVWFKGFPAKGVTIDQIKAHAKQVIQTCELKPRAIFIDYAETVKPMAVKKNTPDWREQADIYVQARALGSELGCCVIMPDRCNRETVNSRVPNMTSFQGGFEKAGVVDAAIGLCATDEEFMQKRIRYFVFLNRHGAAMQHFSGRIDPDLMRMSVDEEIEYDPESEENNSKGRAFNRKGKSGKGESKASLDYLKTQAA